MVALGETVTEPEGTATAPTPWSIVSDVTLAEVQLKVALCPPLMVAGFAVKLTVPPELDCTVTVTEAVMVEPLKLAVAV